MLLNKGDGVADLLCCVLLNVVLAVAQRGGELEHGNAVLELEALGDDAVAEERAVAGGVALHGAGTEDGGVVVYGDADLGLRHGTYVARKAELLRHVYVVLYGVLIEQHRDIGGDRLAAQALEIGEAHHEGGHLVLVDEDDLLGELLVIAHAPVAAEKAVEQLGNVFYYQDLLYMANTEVLPSQALGVAVDHHGHGKVVCHPAVAEHGLYVPRLDDELAEGHEYAQPAAVIVQRVAHAAPLAAFADLAVGIEITEPVGTYLLSHWTRLPVSF